MTAVSMVNVTPGDQYVYTNASPVDCKGKRYEVLCVAVDVPTYQVKVVVRGINGPDAGMCYVVSESRFVLMFERVAKDM